MNTLLDLLQDIEKMLQGVKLLNDIWDEVGPYNDGVISDKTRFKMQDYFNFDDSE